ncbi:MAG TPA: type VI secretion system tip protein TssI/VgrG [Pirellulales bacterium]|nr:type VI secretion system tip protein TssI/VgrG [Pirellulales bacterium]
MATFTQENRKLALSIPSLGDDVLLLQSFSGEEHLSRLFEYELVMFSEQDSIAPDDVVGTNVTITVLNLEDEPRYFNGFINSFSYVGRNERLHEYRARVVPWLWFLTCTTDCRIFQSKSIPDILQQVFKDLGFTDFAVELQGQHQPHDYCVQYNESDFAFVSRLMEEEGIFYFFRHKDGKHTLVVADNVSSYSDCDDNSFQFGLEPPEREFLDNLSSWEHRYEYRSGKLTHTDYNFETPGTDLRTQTNSVIDIGENAKFDLYEFPGSYGTTSDGQALAKLRMEAEEAGYNVVYSSGRAPSLTPGGKFSIAKHVVQAEEGQGFVITGISHRAHAGSAYLTGDNTQPASYSNRFVCIPDSVIYRPPRTTTPPRIHGLQTAVVTGPAGEEIWPDKYGRVKVHFFWDREGKKDEHSSCWIRVSQIHAGKTWGGMTIPRIGEEVLVAFLEGDPDRPIIVGRLYNAAEMPPYTLPDHKTQSGMKSRSTLGGSGANYNELRFEDKKGHEHVLLHAEKDQMIEVENNESHWVGHDRTKTIDNDETTHVKANRTETVDKNETITIHGNRTETVDKDETITIGQNRTETVGTNESVTVGNNRSFTLGKDQTISVGGSQTQSIAKDDTTTIGNSRSETVGQNESVTIGSDRSVTVGKADSLSVATILAVSSGDSITLQAGAASITMKKDGTIVISGKDITINGSGAVNIKASKDVVVKGQKILQN